MGSARTFRQLPPNLVLVDSGWMEPEGSCQDAEAQTAAPRTETSRFSAGTFSALVVVAAQYGPQRKCRDKKVPDYRAVVAGLRSRVRELEEEVAHLEGEVDVLDDAICNQVLHLLGGYIITVYPTSGGTFIASCPTLHASVEGATSKSAIGNLREAMSLVQHTFTANGIAIPEKDIEGKCLDSAP